MEKSPQIKEKSKTDILVKFLKAISFGQFKTKLYFKNQD